MNLRGFYGTDALHCSVKELELRLEGDDDHCTYLGDIDAPYGFDNLVQASKKELADLYSDELSGEKEPRPSAVEKKKKKKREKKKGSE